MAYYRPQRETWELEISKLPAGLREKVSRAARITKEVTRFRYRFIDLPELKRRLRSIPKI